MLILRYAYRNLARHRARTVLTTLAVVLAVALLLVGNTLIDGLKRHIMGEYTSNTGHVRIRNKSYDKESRFEPLDYTVAPYRELVARIEKIPDVATVLPRIRFGMMLQHTDTSTMLSEAELAAVEDESTLTDEQIFGKKVIEFAPGVAIAPERDAKINKLTQQLVAGTYFDGKDIHEVMLGVELARRLGVKANDSLELVSYRDGVSDAEVRIVGLFDAKNTLANRQAYVPLPLAEGLLRMPNQATELLVFATDITKSGELLTALAQHGLGEDWTLTEWRHIGLMRIVSQLFDVVFGGLTFAILLVAAAGLLNTMLMSVFERQREIGVLLALGLDRRSLVSAILLEAVIFAIAGSIIGALVGSAGSFYLVEHGIKVGAASRSLPIAVGDAIHGYFTAAAVVRAMAVGVLTAVVGALWPALKGSSVDPVIAMRRR